jgi:N-dimethylarginine dimethylaminohydrolase
LIAPQPRLPDMVFTANAGLTVDRRFIPSNFRHKERAGEQPFFAKWMEQHGYEVDWLPEKLYFEGEGDAFTAGNDIAGTCEHSLRPLHSLVGAGWGDR